MIGAMYACAMHAFVRGRCRCAKAFVPVGVCSRIHIYMCIYIFTYMSSFFVSFLYEHTYIGMRTYIYIYTYLFSLGAERLLRV